MCKTWIQFGQVLFVSDLLHPFDHFAVEGLCDGNVRHGGGRSCAVPMPFIRRTPDSIAGPNFEFRLIFTLDPTAPTSDD